MADPVDFDLQNNVLNPAPGDEDNVRPLPVFVDGAVCVSCWKLTEEELKEVNRTGVVWLLVASGSRQPPVVVAGTPLVSRHYDS